MSETAKFPRQAGYNVTGHAYEWGIYSSRNARAYHRRRCESLQAAIEERFSANRRLRILEIGCGTGMTLDFLATQPAKHELWGLDFSTTMLGYANEKAQASPNPAQLLVGNALELPFASGTFDVVYGTRFIHQFHHEDKKKIYGEVRRVTRAGGLIAFEFYSRPYNTFRYFTDQRNKYDTREEYFSHYPSTDEINDLAGGEYESVSLRFAFARWINRILGYRAFGLFNDAARVPPLRFLVDEYWVFVSNANAESEPAKDDVGAKPLGFHLLRCSRCKGELERDESPPRVKCSKCQLAYPIRDGIPNLLLHEAGSLSE